MVPQSTRTEFKNGVITETTANSKKITTFNSDGSIEKNLEVTDDKGVTSKFNSKTSFNSNVIDTAVTVLGSL